MPADLLLPDDGGIATAAGLLRAGGLVAFPTETVYGLGADATSPAAVQRIFAAKGRPSDNPLIVHLADQSDLAAVVATVTPLAQRLAAACWPGPLTMVLEAAPALPAATTAGLRTVAVRVPDHPVAAALLLVAGIPVAAPSANRSGRPSPTTAGHVAADLGDRIDAIVDGGPCMVGVESTVVDVRGAVPIVLREGAVTREHLADLAAPPAANEPADAELAASPGTRHQHYRPSCEVRLAPAGEGPMLAASLASRGHRVGLIARSAAPASVIEIARFNQPAELAARLYAALRDAEAAGVEIVVVESVEEVGLGRAVMDRLRRAAA